MDLLVLLTYAWVPVPGFPARWSQLPRFRVEALPTPWALLFNDGISFVLMWHLIHAHGSILYILGTPQEYTLLCWSILKLWVICFFHGTSLAVTKACLPLAGLALITETYNIYLVHTSRLGHFSILSRIILLLLSIVSVVAFFVLVLFSFVITERFVTAVDPASCVVRRRRKTRRAGD